LPQSRKQPACHITDRQTAAEHAPSNVAVTLCLDADLALRLRAIADALHYSLADHIEAVLLRDFVRREAADRLITMFVAPGAWDSIRPEDIVRAEGDSDADYAAHQALAVELWSITDNAGAGFSFLGNEPDLYSDADIIERNR
jgi:hypothetical protein